MENINEKFGVTTQNKFKDASWKVIKRKRENKMENVILRMRWETTNTSIYINKICNIKEN